MSTSPPNLRDMTAFLVVAEELGFRKAAERLGLDQSVLSRRIKQLEVDLGFPLLFRTTREVALTDAGRIMVERGGQVLRDLDQAIDHARMAAEGAIGRLRVAYMSFAAIRLMPDVVKGFSTRHPEVRLDLVYMRTSAQLDALRRDRADVGFLLGPVEDPAFETLTAARERLRLVLPNDHALAKVENILMRDVAALPLVLGTSNEWDFFRALLDRLFAARGLGLTVAREASSTMGILGLVAGGLGPTIYVESVARVLPEGLVARPIADCDELITTALCWNRGRASPVLRHFLAVARTVIGRKGQERPPCATASRPTW